MSIFKYLSLEPIIINIPLILSSIIPPIISILFANKFIEKNTISTSIKTAIIGITIGHFMSLLVYFNYYYFILAVGFTAFFSPFVVTIKTKFSATWFL